MMSRDTLTQLGLGQQMVSWFDVLEMERVAMAMQCFSCQTPATCCAYRPVPAGTLASLLCPRPPMCV
jgi:NAD dependent epimerase/dehydratase family enzyme